MGSRYLAAGRYEKMTRALALATVLGAAGCVSYHPGTSVPSPASWQEVRLADLGFAARMPGQPIVQREAQQAPDGAPMTEVTGSVALREMIFGFTVTEDRAGFDGHPMHDGAFVDLAAQAVPQQGAAEDDLVLRDERSFLRDGFVVHEAVLLSRSTGIEVRARYYEGRTRIYSALTMYPAGRAAQFVPISESFFDSVRLDPSEATMPNGDGRLDESAWQYIYPPGGDFAVLIPGDPRRTESSAELDATHHPVFVYSVTDGARTYAVMEVQLGGPGTPEHIDALSSALTRGDLEVNRTRDVHCRGFAGREVVYRSGHEEVRSRYFLTAGRVYEIRVTGSGEGSTGSDAANRFFDSFRIL